MSKKNQPKEKNPKAEKMKNIAAVVALVAGGGFVAWDYGLIPGLNDSSSISRSASTSVNRTSSAMQAPAVIPPGADFVQSTDPSKPSKIIQKTPPPQRVQAAKDMTTIVTDYVDASKDKDAAIDSLNYTMMLPSVNKKFIIQEKNTQIAKLRFEELEWDKKISDLKNKDSDGFSTDSISFGGIEEYSKRVTESVESVDGTEENEYKGPSASNFLLDGVTMGKEGLIAHLRVEDRTMRVKDRSVIFGYYTVRLNSIDDVSLCHEAECVSVY